MLSMSTATEITIESLQVQLLERDQKIIHLEEQIAWIKRQIFGQKSERIIDTNPEQLKFDGFEKANQPKPEIQTIPAHQRKNGSLREKTQFSSPMIFPSKQRSSTFLKKKKFARKPENPCKKLAKKLLIN